MSELFPTKVRWTDRLASLTLARLVVWVAIAAWVHQGIFTDAFRLADWMDDHQFYAWEQADRMTLLRFGELPAWNPYWCGGTVGVAAPEDPFFGPDFLLRLVYGVAHGRRLAILLLVVLGFEGMYRLCRRLDATVVAAGFAAVIYGTCDRFVGFIHDGWINFLGFELIPWVILCLLQGISSVRYRVLGGFFFAWIVLSAGTYPTPFTLMTMAYVTLALSVKGWFSEERRAWLKPWWSAITIGLVALGLSFGKLVPTLVFLRQFPRVFTPVETHIAPELFSGFFAHYGVVVVLALIGLVLADSAAGIFCGGAILFYALGMGDFGKYSPFHLLKDLPIFSQLRFPDRYMVLVLFFAAICAARGISRLEDLLPETAQRIWAHLVTWRRWKWKTPELPREAMWVLVGLATFLSYRTLRPMTEEVLEQVRIKPGQMYVIEPPRRLEQPFKQSRGNRRDAHVFPMVDMGSLYCVAGNPLPESPLLRGDLPQEEYPEDPKKATVKRLSWTPNTITLEVDAKEPATIFVNQNYAKEWRANVGTVKSVQNLLAIDVPAGKNVLRLEYRDRALTACLMVSLVTLLGIFVFFAREGYRWVRAEKQHWGQLVTWPDELIKSDAKPTEAPVEERPSSEKS